MHMKNFNELMKKELNRKEFILYSGVFILTVTGVSAILKNTFGISLSKTEKGFGGGPYGA